MISAGRCNKLHERAGEEGKRNSGQERDEQQICSVGGMDDAVRGDKKTTLDRSLGREGEIGLWEVDCFEDGL
jgi:hypothetical protein